MFSRCTDSVGDPEFLILDILIQTRKGLRRGEGQALALRAPSGRRGFQPRLPGDIETREGSPTRRGKWADMHDIRPESA